MCRPGWRQSLSPGVGPERTAELAAMTRWELAAYCAAIIERHGAEARAAAAEVEIPALFTEDNVISWDRTARRPRRGGR